jgi:hypothetical protein
MARPQRNNVDYFPFLCKEGKTMYFIEQKYGNDGYATWIKLLRELAVTDFHFLNLSNKAAMMFLASKCKIEEDVLINIIDDLCELGEFHTQLWLENKVVFSPKFLAHIADAYKSRKNNCITLEGLLDILSDLGVRKLYKPLRELPENPQTIVKNTKEENTIVTAGVFPESNINLLIPFGSPEFLKLWNEWVQYRIKLRKPYQTDITMQRALDMLSKHSEEVASAMIRQSMDKGWKDLYPLDPKNQPVQSGTKAIGYVRGQKPIGG